MPTPMRSALLMAPIVAAATMAHAGTITHHLGSVNQSMWQVASFPQLGAPGFNTSLGTLTSIKVTMTWEINIPFRWAWSNFTQTDQTLTTTARAGAEAELFYFDPAGIQSMDLQFVGAGPVSRTQFVPAGSQGFTNWVPLVGAATSSHTYNMPLGTTGIGRLQLPDFHYLYARANPKTLTLFNSYVPGEGAYLSLSADHASATYEVGFDITYDYIDNPTIPLPHAAGMGLTGLLMLGARRRR